MDGAVAGSGAPKGGRKVTHMTHGRRAMWLLGVVAAAGLSLVGTQAAEAHGRGGGRIVIRGGYGLGLYGMGPFGWYGYSPFFAPYWAYGPYQAPAVDMNYAMMAGFGAIDMNVKPNHAEVWVDGKYAGEARDLDGDPTYLWLKDGAHHIAVYKGGYKTFDEQVDVTRGVKRELKVRLEPGNSLPPGTKPTDKGLEHGKTKDAPGGVD